MFEGVDSLDCIEPMGGDNQFGYCRIPGTEEFYVWGRCVDVCPESPYPGIELLRLASSSETLDLYSTVIEDRDTQLDERRDGLWRGGILGGVGVAGGAVGVGELCVASGSWNWGVGCVIVLLAVAADLGLTGWGFFDAYDANSDLNDPNGLNASAAELFGRLHEQQ